MSEHPYYDLFRNKDSINDPSVPWKTGHDVQFLKYIKGLFFDTKQSKWGLKKYKKFVKKEYLSYRTCYDVLLKFSESPYFYSVKGAEGYKTFVKEIKKYNANRSANKMPVKKKYRWAFLEDQINQYDKYHDVSIEELIHHIAEGFDIGWTVSTIRTYIFEIKREKKIFPK